MKFFEFSPNTFQWNININQEDYGKVIAPMNDNEWVAKESLPIKMRLIDAYEDIDLWQGETPFVDALGWYTNITTADIEPNKGVNLVISKKVKEILEKYSLPEHRFYPTAIYCKELKETNGDYYLFHIVVENARIGDDIIDYSKCTFVEITQNSERKNIPIKIHSEGSILSKTYLLDIKRGDIELLGSYKKKRGNKEITRLNKLEFKNKVYKYDYDVLWGLSGVLYISEEIKKELEAVGITNGHFYEMSENMIRPFEYEQMKNS